LSNSPNCVILLWMRMKKQGLIDCRLSMLISQGQGVHPAANLLDCRDVLVGDPGEAAGNPGRRAYKFAPYGVHCQAVGSQAGFAGVHEAMLHDGRRARSAAALFFGSLGNFFACLHAQYIKQFLLFCQLFWAKNNYFAQSTGVVPKLKGVNKVIYE
jgi:hypothetical protein